MISFTEIQEYFRQLCREHVMLQHETNGVAFIPLNTDDESGSQVKGIKKTYVKLIDISSAGRDEYSLIYIVTLRFLKNLRVTEARKNELETAWNETQSIMFDIDARVRQDAEDDDKCFFANRLLEPSYELVELVDQSAVGWDYNFRFISDKKKYDATKWQ